MEHKHRDFIVGTFALIAISCFGWLLFMFGDLPGFVSRMDADIISIYFQEVPGIQENSAVYFKGFPVGKVIAISPPAIRPIKKENTKSKIYAIVDITIAKEHTIPGNVIPKIFQRGLGASYIDLTLPDEPSDKPLDHNMVLNGEVSQGSDFISENTQNKLDSLISSMTKLSESLQSQLSTTTPADVDLQNDDTTANLTTAIIRLDSTLKSINEIVGSSQNQNNIRIMLDELAATSSEAKELVSVSKEHIQQTSNSIDRLVSTTEQAVNNINSSTQKISDSLQATINKAQTVEEEMIVAIKTLQNILLQAVDGEGSIERLLSDPTLYESLTDSAKKLTLTLEEMQQLLEKWQEKGVKMKL